ncbi:MAG: hypothetical protein AAF203_01660, partial [Pseudomonadota bacterium]
LSYGSFNIVPARMFYLKYVNDEGEDKLLGKPNPDRPFHPKFTGKGGPIKKEDFPGAGLETTYRVPSPDPSDRSHTFLFTNLASTDDSLLFAGLSQPIEGVPLSVMSQFLEPEVKDGMAFLSMAYVPSLAEKIAASMQSMESELRRRKPGLKVESEFRISSQFSRTGFTCKDSKSWHERIDCSVTLEIIGRSIYSLEETSGTEI